MRRDVIRETVPTFGRPAFWLTTIGLALLVWGARLAVVDRFGSDLPYQDQWDAEAAQTLIPFFEDRLAPKDFFAPHNEHRVALTRAIALGLVTVGGRWDARVQCVVNAALHATLAVAIFLFGRSLLTPRCQWIWTGSVALLFALPIAWNNIVAGFHSQQILLIGLSLIAIACLLAAEPGRVRWWCGVASALLALFSMGSGLLAAVVVPLVTALARPKHPVTWLACALIMALGAALHVHVIQHDPLRAGSLAEFLTAWWVQLQWPARFFLLFPLLVWLPWLVLGRRLWRRRREGIDPRELVVFAVGLWVVLQFAATAYARGAGAPWPTSRYLDTAILGLAVNVLALLLVYPGAPLAPAKRRMAMAAIVAGAGMAGAGLYLRVRDNLVSDLPAHRALMRERAATTRAYLQSGNRADAERGEMPGSNVDAFIAQLGSPRLRAVLPASVVPDKDPPWLSRAAQTTAKSGTYIAIAGIGALAAGFILAGHRRSAPL